MKKLSAVIRTFLVALAVGVFANICSAGLQEGVVAYQRGDFSAALHELRPLAENGDATAQAFLGLMYEYGHAVKMDDVQAAKWIQKAADGGNAMAQGNLSSLYFFGFGVPRDIERARYWKKKAAENGDPYAQCDFGLMYLKGRGGMKKDPAHAALWFRKAADQGYAEAQHQLAVLYEQGQGVPQDYQQAATWYRKAAEQGYVNVQYRLGTLYEQGLGVAKNLVIAYVWLKLAAAGNVPHAAEERDKVARLLTPPEKARAEKLFSAWKPGMAIQEINGPERLKPVAPTSGPMNTPTSTSTREPSKGK